MAGVTNVRWGYKPAFVPMSKYTTGNNTTIVLSFPGGGKLASLGKSRLVIRVVNNYNSLFYL